MRNLLLALSFVVGIFSFAQNTKNYDVLDYIVNIEVSDENDTIQVYETIVVEFTDICNEVVFDLKSLNEKGMGMVMTDQINILENLEPIQYTHRNDSLVIQTHLGKNGAGSSAIYEFEFKGIPANGLIIGKNKFEDRTFFGDNWPNRAHHWFACYDHPSDKAKVSFIVTSPKHYECIATGTLQRMTELEDGRIVHHYKSDIELPTKVMVIGLADFTWEKMVHDHDFPLTVWPYEKDAMNGFRDMAVAKEVVDFFIKNIGDYPFEKLANVQSTTMFGGMENAGNIFYDENAVSGNKEMEALIAHEIAHQWFGNSASESDWQHLWLSEGFATYMTDLYWEQTKGPHAFKERMMSERDRVVGFMKQYDHPVVDTTYAELMHLLNPNSYQKGAWYLHMLRTEVGDSIFWKGIRDYYQVYKYSNASTSDFIQIMDELSEKDIKEFSSQWLHEAGHPILEIRQYQKSGKNVLRIEQKQTHHVFNFPIDIEFEYDDGTTKTQSFRIKDFIEDIDLKTGKTIKSFKVDPDVKLLFEKHQ